MDDRWIDSYTNEQYETIIPCHYCVAGYKNGELDFSEEMHCNKPIY